MGYTGNGTGVPHSIQKFLLILSGMFPGELHFDVQSLAVINAMTPNISLAVVSHIHDSAILGKELAYRMVSSNAAVLTEGYDNLVL